MAVIKNLDTQFGHFNNGDFRDEMNLEEALAIAKEMHKKGDTKEAFYIGEKNMVEVDYHAVKCEDCSDVLRFQLSLERRV